MLKATKTPAPGGVERGSRERVSAPLVAPDEPSNRGESRLRCRRHAL